MDQQNYDRDKVIEYMFNPDSSKILAELEDGGKEPSYLAEKLGISQEEVKNRLGYLLEHDFVKEEQTPNGKTILCVDADRLTKIIEDDDNFDNAVDGLTKMDSYLN